MISDITFPRWIMLIFSFVLYLGPGSFLYSLTKRFNKKSLSDFIPFSLMLSTGVWTFILIIIRFSPLKFNRVTTVFFFLSFWLFFIIKNYKFFSKSFFKLNYQEIILIIALTTVIIVSLTSIKNAVAGLGSDSLHHTIITQLIIDNGKAPKDYLPYAPIVSFSYHIGFHSFAAAISLISNIPSQLIIPILGQILIGLSGLSIYVLSKTLFSNKNVPVLSGIIGSIALVFPFYLLNWGRFPQLFGLVFLPIVLSVFITWHNENYAKKETFGVSFILFTLGITHYRVFIMFCLLIIIYFIIFVFNKNNKINFSFFKTNLLTWIQTVFYTFIFMSPWLISSLISLSNGYSVNLGKPEQDFFSINRLGTEVINFPTNFIALILLVVSILFFIKTYNKSLTFLYSWIIILFILSGPHLLNEYMDTNSVLMSLFIPVSIIISWTLSRILINSPLKKYNVILLSLIVFIVIVGNSLIYNYTNVQNSFVTINDKSAFNWIKNNLPNDVIFISNTFAFPFNPNYIIGIDGGYWLTFFSERENITIPMVYPLENLSSQYYFDRLKTVHNLDFSNYEQTHTILINYGITHIFLGEKSNQKINPEYLVDNYYSLIYKNGSTMIYEVIN